MTRFSGPSDCSALKKVGHTGSLDPLATGVLPLCFGEATKFSQFLLDADKKYRARICLGVSTETGDADGEVIAEADASSVTAAQVAAELKNFVGEIEQVPSMYSALKHQGQPLYKLARQGVEVERAPRKVTVYCAELLQVTGTEIELLCTVAKARTYGAWQKISYGSGLWRACGRIASVGSGTL